MCVPPSAGTRLNCSSSIERQQHSRLSVIILPHAELTINLLRQSRLHPHISAWEHFNGPFNFDATPLGPPGCKIIGHARGSTRLSWDYRGHMGFYVGPALDHYRCHKILKTWTSAVIISLAPYVGCRRVVFLPKWRHSVSCRRHVADIF